MFLLWFRCQLHFYGGPKVTKKKKKETFAFHVTLGALYISHHSYSLLWHLEYALNQIKGRGRIIKHAIIPNAADFLVYIMFYYFFVRKKVQWKHKIAKGKAKHELDMWRIPAIKHEEMHRSIFKLLSSDFTFVWLQNNTLIYFQSSSNSIWRFSAVGGTHPSSTCVLLLTSVGFCSLKANSTDDRMFDRLS